jgi:hypothetical protein
MKACSSSINMSRSLVGPQVNLVVWTTRAGLRPAPYWGNWRLSEGGAHAPPLYRIPRLIAVAVSGSDWWSGDAGGSETRPY